MDNDDAAIKARAMAAQADASAKARLRYATQCLHEVASRTINGDINDVRIELDVWRDEVSAAVAACNEAYTKVLKTAPGN